MKKKLFITSVFLFTNFLLGQTPTFTDVTDLAGIDDIDKIAQPFGYGASLADFDNDGDIDFFLATDSGIPNRLYQNNGDNTFMDIASEVGLASMNPSNASLWFDYNGDHLLDLIVVGNCVDTSCETKIMVDLYQQNPDGNFNNTTEEARLIFGDKYSSTNTNPLVTTGGLSAGDVNNDGYLDLLITIWKGENSFFINNGDGTFSDESITSGFCLKENDNWQAIFNDFNNDGLMDIYFNIDFTSNELWINKGNNVFEEMASNSGIDFAFNEMGIALGDYDNDGDFDMYATNITTDGKHNIFLKNDTQNNFPFFTEISKSIGVAESGWDWGTTFFDANNDGWLDLASTNGYVSFPADKSKLWINNKEGVFADVSDIANFNDKLFATSLMAFDMDRDGDLDLLQTLKENENTNKPVLLLNNSLSNEGNYIVIKPRMLGKNHFSIGAVIKIKSGNLNGTRFITAGTSFYGQEPAEAFFGLYNNTVIEQLKIEWPDNTITILENIEVNQVLTVTNQVVEEEVLGCTDSSACNYNPIANVNDGSCIYFSTNKISGTNESGFAKIETYSYDNPEDLPLRWSVEGGEIIEGQGTNKILIRWGLNKVGKVSVSIQNEICSNSIVFIDITLNIENRPVDMSIARLWNEVLLYAIRNDFARPTVHARNLFHSSIIMYDIWAIYNGAHTYLIDNELNSFKNNLNKFVPNDNLKYSLNESISYAMYRLLNRRFKDSPKAAKSLDMFDLVMQQLGYDTGVISTQYESGEAAALGNYVAQIIIEYGLRDNSREITGYDNEFYEPKNPELDLYMSDSPYTGILDPNHWQPLGFSTFIDQSGNLISESTPAFLSPEWGNVYPFALSQNDKINLNRDGNDYIVYHNPEAPPKLNTNNTSSSNSYKWNFSLVSIWSSHLDPNDGVMWDISPKSIGNIDISLLPNEYSGYSNFYNELDGGDISIGRNLNPITGQPYTSQIVPRGDYTRVLAEFWADGPDSETPPGHWFTILNTVSDHELFLKKFNGEGETLSPLEWDVKSYFILGGAMHDAAIAAWGIKGWYDYIRPISAIRYMCELGQSTDSSLPNYHPNGIQLKEGYIEMIDSEDSLSGDNNENVNKIKLYAWLGHDFVNNSSTDVAGVGWVQSEKWWPYQRPSFVTPPFAGFVSGHSTFSRAAAEVLTLITGDEYFPGGLGEFIAKKNEFLVFEKGPSVDVRLQWATYRDASDQTSLSRIWGGIHPPVDDIPGRIIGEKVGVDAYNYALPYFEKSQKKYIESNSKESKIILYPNPTANKIFISSIEEKSILSIFSLNGKMITNSIIDIENPEYDLSNLPVGIYIVKLENKSNNTSKLIIKK